MKRYCLILSVITAMIAGLQASDVEKIMKKYDASSPVSIDRFTTPSPTLERLACNGYKIMAEQEKKLEFAKKLCSE